MNTSNLLRRIEKLEAGVPATKPPKIILALPRKNRTGDPSAQPKQDYRDGNVLFQFYDLPPKTSTTHNTEEKRP